MPMTVAKMRENLRNYDGEFLVAVSDMHYDAGREVLHIYDMGEDDADIVADIELPANHL